MSCTALPCSRTIRCSHTHTRTHTQLLLTDAEVGANQLIDDDSDGGRWRPVACYEFNAEVELGQRLAIERGEGVDVTDVYSEDALANAASKATEHDCAELRKLFPDFPGADPIFPAEGSNAHVSHWQAQITDEEKYAAKPGGKKAERPSGGVAAPGKAVGKAAVGEAAPKPASKPAASKARRQPKKGTKRKHVSSEDEESDASSEEDAESDASGESENSDDDERQQRPPAKRAKGRKQPLRQVKIVTQEQLKVAQEIFSSADVDEFANCNQSRRADATGGGGEAEEGVEYL